MNNLDNLQQNGDEAATYEAESRGVAMNLFAILGFVAILLAGLWATVQLVNKVSQLSFNFDKPSLSIPFFGGDDALAITTPEGSYNSGESAQIAWSLGDSAEEAEGVTLSFSYACKKGLYIKVQEVSSDSYRALPCNAPYNVPAIDTSLHIMPVLTGDEPVEAAYSLTYAPITDTDEAVEQVAYGTLKVVLADAVTTDSTVKPATIVDIPKDGVVANTTTKIVKTVKKTYTSTPHTTKNVYVAPTRKSDPNGLADLTIKVLSVSAVDVDGKVAVRFEVANLGTKLADNWTFTATLPTNPPYTYVSPAQSALYAGERAELLLTFDRVILGNNPLLLAVDAYNVIVESLETNNSIITTVVR